MSAPKPTKMPKKDLTFFLLKSRDSPVGDCEKDEYNEDYVDYRFQFNHVGIFFISLVGGTFKKDLLVSFFSVRTPESGT